MFNLYIRQYAVQAVLLEDLGWMNGWIYKWINYAFNHYFAYGSRLLKHILKYISFFHVLKFRFYKYQLYVTLCYFLPVSMARKSTFTLGHTDCDFRLSGLAIRSHHHTSILWSQTHWVRNNLSVSGCRYIICFILFSEFIQQNFEIDRFPVR